MASKQKSIFEEPVKARSRKEQTKTDDEFVPFGESIFARTKKAVIDVQPECFDSDDEDAKFVVHDDEVPLEESIFAKPKKGKPQVTKLSTKENKINLEELFNKYQELYGMGYMMNVGRLNMIDVNTYNVCCMNLENSKKVERMNINTYDLVKEIIKSVCMGVADTFYCYTNMNRALLDYIAELHPDMDVSVKYHIVDKSYSEVLDEFGGKLWQR